MDQVTRRATDKAGPAKQLRGSGAHIVTEPLTQAERDVLYTIWEFERFKRTFAVNVASEYYAVLQALDQIDNEEKKIRNLGEDELLGVFEIPEPPKNWPIWWDSM